MPAREGRRSCLQRSWRPCHVQHPCARSECGGRSWSLQTACPCGMERSLRSTRPLRRHSQAVVWPVPCETLPGPLPCKRPGVARNPPTPSLLATPVAASSSLVLRSGAAGAPRQRIFCACSPRPRRVRHLPCCDLLCAAPVCTDDRVCFRQLLPPPLSRA